jgi:hypothetical protein
MTGQLFPITIQDQTFHLTKQECADLRQQLWKNYWLDELITETQTVVNIVAGGIVADTFLRQTGTAANNHSQPQPEPTKPNHQQNYRLAHTPHHPLPLDLSEF